MNLLDLINSIKSVITTISKNKNILGNILIEDLFDTNYKVKNDIIYYKLDEKQLDNYPSILQILIQHFYKIKDRDPNQKYYKNELIKLLLNEKQLDLEKLLSDHKDAIPDIEERYENGIHKLIYGNNKKFDVYEWVNNYYKGKNINKEQLDELFKDFSVFYKYDLNYYEQFLLDIAIYNDIIKLWKYFFHVAINILANYIDDGKFLRKIIFKIEYIQF